MPSKVGVGFHRSYRKLHYGSLSSRIVSHLLLLAFLSGLVYYFLEHLTLIFSGFAAAILKDSISGLRLVQIKMLYSQVWLIYGNGMFPSRELLLLATLLSLIAWFLVILIKRIPLPITLSVKVISTMNIFGCIYFWFFANKFPYDLNAYSTLYISAEIGMWIAVPLMLIFALMPVPVSVLKKGLLVAATVIYIYIFGIIRYALFLYIIARFSYLWMAFLYFVLGVLVDFVLMIIFYSVFVSLAAPGIYLKRGIWRWLLSY